MVSSLLSNPLIFTLLVSAILGLILFFIKKSITSTPSAEQPFFTGKLKLPGPARDRLEAAYFRRDLDMLLDKREEFEKTLAEFAYLGPQRTAQICTHLRQFACRRKNIAALALAAALCRLCPEDPPDGKPRARLEELLHLAGKGEGHFLLGLSNLCLYTYFCTQHKSLAQDAWRRAVEHFRHSGSAGSRDGMEAAALLCACGHDLPFTPPAGFQEYLPLLEASNVDVQKDFFWDLADLADGQSMHFLLPFAASNPAAPEALFWNLQLAEAGDPPAMHYLAVLCAGTASPGMARAEEWYRRSMEAGNTSNAAEALCKRYLAGELPDETGQKAAICLIFSACEEQCDEEDIPAGKSVKLTADDMAQLKESDELASEAGRRAWAQLDACKAEGEALHAQARRNLLAWGVREQEKTESCLDTARQKLSALCQHLESKPQPGRRAVVRPDKR